MDLKKLKEAGELVCRCGEKECHHVNTIVGDKCDEEGCTATHISGNIDPFVTCGKFVPAFVLIPIKYFER